MNECAGVALASARELLYYAGHALLSEHATGCGTVLLGSRFEGALSSSRATGSRRREVKEHVFSRWSVKICGALARGMFPKADALFKLAAVGQKPRSLRQQEEDSWLESFRQDQGTRCISVYTQT